MIKSLTILGQESCHMRAVLLNVNVTKTFKGWENPDSWVSGYVAGMSLGTGYRPPPTPLAFLAIQWGVSLWLTFLSILQPAHKHPLSSVRSLDPQLSLLRGWEVRGASGRVPATRASLYHPNLHFKSALFVYKVLGAREDVLLLSWPDQDSRVFLSCWLSL